MQVDLEEPPRIVESVGTEARRARVDEGLEKMSTSSTIEALKMAEVVVLADAKAKPENAAAEIIAQSEHDEEAMGILVTPSAELAEAVEEARAVSSGTPITTR